ncbi:MAG TPA: type II CAAX endopeptidase family protein [Clostridiaceae bacterium]
MKRYLKAVGNMIIYGGLYILIQLFVGIGTIIYVTFRYILTNNSDKYRNQEGFTNNILNQYTSNINLILVISILITFLIYWLIFFAKGKNIFHEAGFRRIGIDKLFLAGALGLGASMVVGSVMNFIPVDKLFPEYNKMISSIMNKENPIFIIIVTSIVVPIFEETLFRGLIFNELKKIAPIIPAIVIQAVIFGVFHGNLLQGSYAFLLALILGITYLWTKSIWVNIFVHMLFNGSNFFIQYLNFIPFIIYIILGAILIIIPMVSIYRNRINNI